MRTSNHGVGKRILIITCFYSLLLLAQSEFLIDRNFIYAPAFGNQDNPAIAFDGTNYFVVWVSIDSGVQCIYGTRITQSGMIMDPRGIFIADSANNPHVIFDGNHYYVVWEDHRQYSVSRTDVYGARITVAGTVLDTSGQAISVAPGFEYSPAVCYDGQNYLVAWHDSRSGVYDIYGSRVTPSGVVLDTILISSALREQQYVSIAFDGVNYCLTWQDNRNSMFDIYGARVSQSGVLLDTTGFVVSLAQRHQQQPEIVFGDTTYLVVWQDDRNLQNDIYGTRLTPGGVVLDTQGIALTVANDHQQFPSLTYNGNEYLVVWQDARNGYFNIFCARVTRSGIVHDTLGIHVAGTAKNQLYPVAANNGNDYFIIWEDLRNQIFAGSDIYGARVDQNGLVLDPHGFVISTSAFTNSSFSPDVAFDGNNFLVAWESEYLYSTRIYANRITQSGNILDSVAFLVADSGQTPAIAFDGTDYLVVWNTDKNIYGVRIDQSGALLDSLPIVISAASNDQIEPDVSFGGVNYLIVWQDRRNSSTYDDIYGARVTPTGTVLDSAGIPISVAQWAQYTPSVAFDGMNFLVVWNDHRDDPWGETYCCRVDENANVLDSTGILINDDVTGQKTPCLAFDGTNYLVVWTAGVAIENIVGARVSPEGSVLDTNAILIAAAAHPMRYPRVIFNDSIYLVVWEDIGTTSDIYGTYVDTLGNPGVPFVVSERPGDQIKPSVACGDIGKAFVVYSCWTDSINGWCVDTMRVWGNLYPFTGISEDENIYMPEHPHFVGPTIVSGPLFSFVNIQCKVFDIIGREIKRIDPPPGVYFIQADGRIKWKIVKIR